MGLRPWFADLLGGEIDHHPAEHHHQQFHHHHARAGEIVEQLAEEHHVQAAPRRAFTRILRSLCRSLVAALGLEIAVVDGVERRLFDEEVPEPAAGVDHDGSSLGADVALSQQAIAGRTGLVDRLHASHFRKLFGEPLAVRLDLDVVAAAENLARQLRHGAEQHDVARLEQGHPVAHALHPLEQMRRDQHRDAVALERADHFQKLSGRLRIETRGRFIENGDLGVLHQDFGKASRCLMPRENVATRCWRRRRGRPDQAHP